MAKKIISASVPEYISDWLQNEYGDREKSAFITKLLENEYKSREDPISLIKTLEKEKKEICDKLDYNYHKSQKIIEDGNKKEREEAKKILEDKEEKELEYRKDFIKLLDSIRVYEGWEAFVDNYDNCGPKEIIAFNESLNTSGIETGGWGRLKELMQLFTKEQLKGGMVLCDSENVKNVEITGQS